MTKMNGRKIEAAYLETEWSDEVLENLAESIKFPKEVYDRQEVKSIISRFFYFYFTGKVTSDCSVPCTIYSAISLLNTYNSKGFSRIFDARNYMSIGDTIPFFKVHLHESDELKKYFKDLDNEKQDFKAEIGKILLNWDTIKTYNKEKSKLMRLSAFLALKLCCVASRSKQKIIQSFFPEVIKSTLQEIVGWDSKIKFYYLPPNLETIDECITELAGDDISRYSLKSLFTIVVYEWIKNVKYNPKNEIVSSLLFDSLLEDTAGNGIAFITLMIAVKYCENVTYDQLLNALEKEKSSFSKYEDSFENLLEFKSKFLDKKNLQLGYAWARIIESKYLIKYSSKKNTFFCAIFATIVEIYEGSEVWKAEWAKLINPQCLKEAKIVGKRIHDHLNNL